MLQVNFSAYNSYVTDSLTQWDSNRVLSISGLNISFAPILNFNNSVLRESICVQSTLEDGVIKCAIPNALLQWDRDIIVFVCDATNDQYKALEKIKIPVISRAKPSDYLYTDNVTYESIRKIVDDMESRIREVEKEVEDIETGSGIAEVEDIRTGYNGVKYETAGEAVRTQIENLAKEDYQIREDMVSIGKNADDAMAGVTDLSGRVETLESDVKSLKESETDLSDRVGTLTASMNEEVTARCELEDRVIVLEGKKYESILTAHSYDSCTLSKEPSNYDRLLVEYMIMGTNDVINGEAIMSPVGGINRSDYLPLRENTSVSAEMFSTFIFYNESAKQLQTTVNHMTIGDNNSLIENEEGVFEFVGVYGIKY